MSDYTRARSTRLLNATETTEAHFPFHLKGKHSRENWWIDRANNFDGLQAFSIQNVYNLHVPPPTRFCVDSFHSTHAKVILPNCAIVVDRDHRFRYRLSDRFFFLVYGKMINAFPYQIFEQERIFEIKITVSCRFEFSFDLRPDHR